MKSCFKFLIYSISIILFGAFIGTLIYVGGNYENIIQSLGLYNNPLCNFDVQNEAYLSNQEYISTINESFTMFQMPESKLKNIDICTEMHDKREYLQKNPLMYNKIFMNCTAYEKTCLPTNTDLRLEFWDIQIENDTLNEEKNNLNTFEMYNCMLSTFLSNISQFSSKNQEFFQKIFPYKLQIDSIKQVIIKLKNSALDTHRTTNKNQNNTSYNIYTVRVNNFVANCKAIYNHAQRLLSNFNLTSSTSLISGKTISRKEAISICVLRSTMAYQKQIILSIDPEPYLRNLDKYGQLSQYMVTQKSYENFFTNDTTYMYHIEEKKDDHNNPIYVNGQFNVYFGNSFISAVIKQRENNDSFNFYKNKMDSDAVIGRFASAIKNFTIPGYWSSFIDKFNNPINKQEELKRLVKHCLNEFYYYKNIDHVINIIMESFTQRKAYGIIVMLNIDAIFSTKNELYIEFHVRDKNGTIRSIWKPLIL